MSSIVSWSRCLIKTTIKLQYLYQVISFTIATMPVIWPCDSAFKDQSLYAGDPSLTSEVACPFKQQFIFAYVQQIDMKYKSTDWDFEHCSKQNAILLFSEMKLSSR